MLAAYLDESYDETAMVVGGCVATTGEWARLEESWRRVLGSEGLEIAGFADILGGRVDRTWSRERREALVSRFVNLIQKHACRALYAVLSFEDLSAVLSLRGGPVPAPDKVQVAYQLCGLACVSGARVFAAERSDPRIRVTFEAGMKGLGLVHDFARWIGDDQVEVTPPASKKDVPALQAADFVASATHRLSRPHAGSTLPPWPHMSNGRRLVAKKKPVGTWLSRENMASILPCLGPFTRKADLAQALAAVAKGLDDKT